MSRSKSLIARFAAPESDPSPDADITSLLTLCNHRSKQKSAKEIGPDVAGQTASCPLEFVLLRPKRYASSGKPLAARPTLAFCFQYWGSWRCCGRLPAGHARKAPISGDSYPLQHRVELADVNGPICLRGVAVEPSDQRLSNFLAGIIKRPTRQRRHFRHRDTAARRAFPPQGTRREKRRPSFFRGLTWRPSDDLAATLRTTSRRARGPRAPMAFWACGRRGLF